MFTMFDVAVVGAARDLPGPPIMAMTMMVLVGDAAGLADPVTAEGISLAAQSGGWVSGWSRPSPTCSCARARTADR
jgi:hypothetical protein